MDSKKEETSNLKRNSFSGTQIFYPRLVIYIMRIINSKNTLYGLFNTKHVLREIKGQFFYNSFLMFSNCFQGDSLKSPLKTTRRFLLSYWEHFNYQTMGLWRFIVCFVDLWLLINYFKKREGCLEVILRLHTRNIAQVFRL